MSNEKSSVAVTTQWVVFDTSDGLLTLDIQVVPSKITLDDVSFGTVDAVIVCHMNDDTMATPYIKWLDEKLPGVRYMLCDVMSCSDPNPFGGYQLQRDRIITYFMNVLTVLSKNTKLYYRPTTEYQTLLTSTNHKMKTVNTTLQLHYEFLGTKTDNIYITLFNTDYRSLDNFINGLMSIKLYKTFTSELLNETTAHLPDQERLAIAYVMRHVKK